MFIMNYNLWEPMNVLQFLLDISALGFSIQVNMKKISCQLKQTKPTYTSSYKKKSAILKNFYATRLV